MLEGILEGQVNPHFSPLQTMKNLSGAMFELCLFRRTTIRRRSFGKASRYQEDPIHTVRRRMAYRIEEKWPIAGLCPRTLVIPMQAQAKKCCGSIRGADLLIHDSTYTPEDRSVRRSRGYSSFADAAYAAVRGFAARPFPL